MPARNNRRRQARSRAGSNRIPVGAIGLPRGMNSAIRSSYQRSTVNQLRTTINVPGNVAQFAVIVSGLGALNKTFDPVTDVTNWASRYQSMFREYRVIGVDVILQQAFPNSGSTTFWIDEATNYTPALNDANENIGVLIPNTNAGCKGTTTLHWRAKELEDLTFNSTGTSSAAAFLKGFTNQAQYGTTPAVASIFTIRLLYMIEFKGYAI